ncbi:LuxR C-terminal-related transcriptional regulator [Nocardioides carbamazepini]|uniref:helix-turn-helix transcriptional regulator n=1 Tax=Nocardioides carbamazepini TaxID=2854259 RepID=UPI00214A5AB2|nr:LuxR C-terminal-related transcriptional regulator [Nocardioides carbamazepini]MCR1786053.1 LuxR C-terminal-related transcriptional regulator [Nocardioides carbamazepini]
MATGSPVLLSRARLHDALDGSPTPLTVVAAPSGFGKTSLARAWVETLDGVDVVWVTLENDLETRSAFWQTVLAAAARVEITEGPGAGLLTEIESSTDPAAVIARGLAGRTRPLLVVDAYEKVRAATAQVDADLLRLVRLVPQLRVVVTTRTPGGLAGPARSLRGEVQLLTEDDLAFTLGETRDLVAAFGPPGTANTAPALHAATHGYPLALRAAMLDRSHDRPRATAGQHDPAWQALVAEDLRVQLERGAAYSFVLATSVPPYFDAELAVELATALPGVTGPAEVKEMLDDLEWNGFGRWIPFAPGHQVFQYVESLRDAMLVEARQRPADEQQRAAERSAAWLHRHGSYEAALEMAVGAGLFSIAARVYAAVVVTTQDANSASLVDRHLASVPSRALTQFPALAFGRGLACFRDPALRGAAADYFRISARWDGPRFPNPTAGEYLLGYVAKVVSLRLLGRVEESGRAAAEALAFHRRMPDGDRERVAFLGPMALRHLAYSQFLAGAPEAARDTTSRAVAMATDPVVRNHTAVYAVGLGAFEGRTVEARSARSLVTADAWRPGEDRSYANALGRIGEAILLLDDFDFAGAGAAFDDTTFRDTTEYWPLLTWTLLHAHIGLGTAAAEARRIEEQLRRTPAPPVMGDSVGAAAVRGALAVAWLAAGNHARATAVLRSRTRYAGQLAPAAVLAGLLAGDAVGTLAALPEWEARPGHTPRSLAALLVLGAAAAARTGQEEAAAALLERVLAQVGPDGARLHLMYLPPEDVAALRRTAARRSSVAVQDHLAVPVPACFVAAHTVVALTRQERAVLAALAQHPSRSELAAAMHLSENTVKTHLQRIYRKLGVSSRKAVIERAIELDLL